ncbi:MAG: hypothetical protein AB7H96_15680 [Vicinamibacterales bacterium]
MNSITVVTTGETDVPRPPASARIRVFLARVLAAPVRGGAPPADSAIRVSGMSDDWLRTHEGESVKHDP